MSHVDVQIRGAGLAGRWLALLLKEAGVTVRLIDPHPQTAAWFAALPLYLPCHPEHPNRFEAALGSEEAAQIIAFIARSGEIMEARGWLQRTGLQWWPFRNEAPEIPRSVAAAARIGLRAAQIEDILFLPDAGIVSGIPDVPIETEPGGAEIEILCSGWAPIDAFLEDKLMPVRWLALQFEGHLPQPMCSWHSTLRFVPGEKDTFWATGAREATPHLEVGETEAHVQPQVQAALEGLSREFFPQTGACLQSKVGIIADSCDGLPIIGPIPGRPRVWVCAGFGSAGFSYVPACAEAIVEGLLTGQPRQLPISLSINRFR